MRRLLVSVAGLCAAVESHAKLERRGGPSGYLVLPNDGTVWDNSYGYGLGHVIYQGVSTNYSFQDITHVMTKSIDIYLSAQDDVTPLYYLAKGINPNPDSLLVDEQFEIPYSYGNYRVVINETQECQSPDMPPIVFQAAAPLVTITANQTAGAGGRRIRRFGRAPRPMPSRELARRGGPSGTLNVPTDGTVWDDTNNFGSGHVQYVGVDQDYANGRVTHVTTHAIDIYLQSEDDSSKHYLAKGIAPKNLTVDVEFQIPPLNGTFRLIINETQECQSPTLPPIVFGAAAPQIYILSGAQPSAQPSSTSTSGSGTSHVGAIAGGVVGGVALIAIIVGLIFLLRRRRKAPETQPTAFVSEEDGIDPVSPTLDRMTFVPMPFDLSTHGVLPPEYTPTAQSPTPSTPAKSPHFSPVSTPDISRYTGGSAVDGHARSVSGGSTGSYFEHSPRPSRPTVVTPGAAGTDQNYPATLAFGASEQVNPHGLSRYPGLKPVYEHRGHAVQQADLEQQAAEPPMRQITPQRAVDYTGIGARPLPNVQTYRPGDILLTNYSRRGA